MKSSFLKIFAGHFQRYLVWLQRQKILDKRKRQLTTRANHYLAYLSLSSSDHSKTFETVEGKRKAWRNYKRFLKESMQYSDDRLSAAVDELTFFHDFVERIEERIASVAVPTSVFTSTSGKIVQLVARGSRAKRLSARPGERQKATAKLAKAVLKRK